MYWELMIHNFGYVKYFCTDGEFRCIMHTPDAQPKRFKSYEEAADTYNRWVLKKKDIRQRWLSRIIEVEE